MRCLRAPALGVYRCGLLHGCADDDDEYAGIGCKPFGVLRSAAAVISSARGVVFLWAICDVVLQR